MMLKRIRMEFTLPQLYLLDDMLKLTRYQAGARTGTVDEMLREIRKAILILRGE